jgi:hypothetical protein
MAQRPRKATARNVNETERNVNENDTAEVTIMIGDRRVITYDASALGDNERENFVNRIIHYADSQSIGMPKHRG